MNNSINTKKIWLEARLRIKGNIKTNSTSNTRKIKLIKKNRMEKGSRALYLGVNPHSKGLIFSRLIYSFLLKLKPNLKIKVIKIKIMSMEEPKKYIS
jgi:hypothetical protein